MQRVSLSGALTDESREAMTSAMCSSRLHFISGLLSGSTASDSEGKMKTKS